MRRSVATRQSCRRPLAPKTLAWELISADSAKSISKHLKDLYAHDALGVVYHAVAEFRRHREIAKTMVDLQRRTAGNRMGRGCSCTNAFTAVLRMEGAMLTRIEGAMYQEALAIPSTQIQMDLIERFVRCDVFSARWAEGAARMPSSQRRRTRNRRNLRSLRRNANPF